jgi:hypothetical protein
MTNKAEKDQQDQLEREVHFAEIGKEVVKNAAYQQAFTIRKAQLFEAFCKTKQDQVDIREEAWRTMQNLNALEDYFKQLLTTGKMAELTLEKINPK